MSSETSNKHRLESLLTPAVLGVAFVALFVPLAFGYRSIVGLLGPLALVTVMAVGQTGSARPVLRALVTPFLPFVLLLLVFAPLQPTITAMLSCLAVVVVYVFARLLRLVFPEHWLAVGIAVVALIVGTIRQLSLSQWGQENTLLQNIAEFNGRNPAGFAVGFGVVAAVVLYVRFVRKPWFREVALGLGVLLMVLLIFSDTVAAVIAAGCALLIVGVLSTIVTLRKGPLATELRPLSLLFLVGSAVVAAVLAVANLVPGLQGGRLSVVQRNFSNFTGRDTIWNCYYGAVESGASDLWEKTLECVPWAQHLHSVFLQSHLIGGWVLVIALIIAFFGSIVLASIRVLTAQTVSSLSTGVFAVAVATAGLTLGTVESYLFSELFFAALIVFMGHPVSRGESSLWDSATAPARQLQS